MEISTQQLVSIFSQLFQADAIKRPENPPKIYPIDEFVIVRCVNAGVYCGLLTAVDGSVVTLKNSYRLWKWHAKEGIALSGLAQYGMDDSKDNKIDSINPVIFLNEWCEIIPAPGLQLYARDWK